jgi:hypothetical protein
MLKMIFHVVGIACVAASLGGLHGQPSCIDFESPTDYQSIAECRQAADPTITALPDGKDKWIVLHYAQVPTK